MIAESLVLCHAPEDEALARYLAEFLAANLPLNISRDAAIGPELDIIEATERALSAEFALVILSPWSVPRVWNRKTWEPMFFERPREFSTLLGFVLAAACKFPELLRRERFFDASTDASAAAREIKRWLLRPVESTLPFERPGRAFEELGRTIADRPGIAAGIAHQSACEFALQWALDFEAVFTVDCEGRTAAGILGEIGSLLGLRMNRRIESNKALLQTWCDTHRALFVLSDVSAEHRDFVAPGGRASVIFTESSGERKYVAAREGWPAVNLLKAQERNCEVLEVLERLERTARGQNDTQALIRIERERFWIRHELGYEGHEPPGPVPAAEEQLLLPFATHAYQSE